MLKRLGFAALCILAVTTTACASSSVFMEDYAPLKYGDLVIMGEVTSIDVVEVSAREFYHAQFPEGKDPQMPVKVVTMSVERVLRGDWDKETFKCYVPGSSNYRQNVVVQRS